MHNEFDRIYAEYHGKVLSYVKARIPNHHDAEDVTADIFVKVMSALDKYDSEKASLSTWIYTIAANAIRDHLRKATIRASHTQEVEEAHWDFFAREEDSCMDGLLNEEMLEVLADALESLSERERTVIILHFYKGIPHKELALQMNLSYANVRFINHKALEKLRTFFRQKEYI